MNIAMFTNTYLPHVGGVANSVARFSEDLRAMGHRVLVVAPEFGEVQNASAEADLLRLPAIQNFNGSDFSLRLPLPFLIAERLEAFAPEVIHSHHPYLLGDSALRAAKQRGLPLVFTHHTLYERYTHYVTPDSEALQRFAVHLSTAYANLCARVVAPSASIAELIAARGVTRPVAVIPTGVDRERFAAGRRGPFRRRHGIPQEALVVGHVGRLAPEKNLAYLAEAVAFFLEPLEEARFLVIGSGPSRAEIAAALQCRGLEERLVLAGSLSGAELRDGYHAMDLFVFASQSETQGMVLTEALAAGVPVIALDGSGVREVVQDRRNGRLLPADTPPQDFAAAAARWIRRHPRTPEEARRIRAGIAGFGRRKCARKLVELYTEAREEARYTGPAPADMDPWERLQERIKAEWDLVESKFAAAVQSLKDRAGPE